MIRVNEVLEYSIANEYVVTAHAVFWALSAGLVTSEDDIDKLKGLDFDKAAVEALVQKNVLGLGAVKLYVVTCKNNWYAFYFARNVLELGSLHRGLFRQEPKQIVEARKLLYQFFIFEHEEMMLIDYRKKILSFPAYIGHAKAQSKVLVRFDSGVKKVV